MQFRSCSTIHKWTGIGDNHLTRNVLLQKILTDGLYADTKKNIQQCDMLIIDEIGMLSSDLHGKAEYICRNVRNSTKVFGGLQVIGCGCFRQLPPVPSSSDPGEYCFKHPLFDAKFPHRIILTEIKRQGEHDLISAIHDVALGNPSKDTVDFIKSLKRPLPRNLYPTSIFGTNFDCDFFNDYKLDKLGGKSRLFRSLDDGPYKYLKATTAPKMLKLKVKSKVIITRNIFNGLVNGLEATVIKMEDDTIKIRVNEDINLRHYLEGKEFDLHRYAFVHRNSSNKILAVRTQFPLKLGYAVTVDKLQGRTLAAVVVDMYNFWRPGQLNVALSCAKGKNFLQVINYNTHAAELKAPDSIDNFYSNMGEKPKEDKSCCSKDLCESQYEVNYVQLPLPLGNEASFEDTHTMISENITIKPFPWNANEFLSQLSTECVTETQKEKKSVLMNVAEYKEMLWFLGKHYSLMENLIEDYSTGNKGTRCNLCFLSAHLHHYFTSAIFIDSCKKAM